MSDTQATKPLGSCADYPVGVKTPTIDVSDVIGIAETPVLVASAFKLMDSGKTDGHYATSWRIVNAAGEEIWKFAYNTTDLNSIKLPRGLLQVNATYQAFCQYFGHSFKSQEGSVEFTTSIRDFNIDSANYPVGIETPNIAIDITNSDATGVAETTKLTASAFELMDTVSGQTDSHYATSWRIVNAAGEEIWKFAYNTIDLTSIELPKGLLQDDVTYHAFCQYFGHSFKSQEGSVEFTNDANSCFITTATCESAGKPDDCAELTMMRKFRDEILLKQEAGQELVKEYYRIAPSIVRRIQVESQSKEIFKEIYQRSIQPIYEALLYQDCQQALRMYVDCVQRLAKRYSIAINDENLRDVAQGIIDTNKR